MRHRALSEVDRRRSGLSIGGWLLIILWHAIAFAEEHDMTPRVEHRMFESMTKSWDSLFEEAAAFATEIGRERLINISSSGDGGRGLVTVWYWSHSSRA